MVRLYPNGSGIHVPADRLTTAELAALPRLEMLRALLDLGFRFERAQENARTVVEVAQ